LLADRSPDPGGGPLHAMSERRIMYRSTSESAEGPRMDATALVTAVLAAETGGLLTLALNRRVVSALPGRRLQWLGIALMPAAIAIELITRGGGQSRAGHSVVFAIVAALLVLGAACYLAGLASVKRHQRSAESDG
jgi:hypothetical protein